MTYPETQTFWVEPTDQVAVGLRRYHSADGSGFTCATSYHDALVYTGYADALWIDRDDTERRSLGQQPKVEHADPRWPTTCERCEYRFTEHDRWQDWQELVWRNPKTEERYVNHHSAPTGVPKMPPGATYYAWWLPSSYRGPDGGSLVVICPNGKEWLVDSRASNCTLPQDTEHRCWIRHGYPWECNITVDKAGLTCAAGAGSIQAGDYHGFLREGVLTAG